MNSEKKDCVLVKSPFTKHSYKVALTKSEIERCKTDEAFINSIYIKCDSLFTKGFVKDEPLEIEAEEIPSCSSEIDEPQEVEQHNMSQTTYQPEMEEMLITLVHQRPPLWNFKLLPKDRSREKVKQLWLEVIEELGVNMTVEAIKNKWKNIKDSFIRASNNVKKKLRSATSLEQRLQADNIKKRHKHYDLLEFLDDTLEYRRSRRRTFRDLYLEEERRIRNKFIETSNIEIDELDDDRPSTSHSMRSTISTQSRKSTGIGAADQEFLSTVNSLKSNTTVVSPTQHFCMRLASSLEKLPRRIRSKLELQLLEIVTNAENEYFGDE